MQLIRIVVALSTLAPLTAWAAPVATVDARGAVYTDTDATTIVTSAVQASATPIPVLTVSGQYLIDVVTSASIDVVSAATPSFEDIRHEGTGGVGYHDEDRAISGTYIYSVENDWRSHTGALTMSHDALQHRLTLSLGGSFTYNEVGRSGDANFDERLLQGSVTAGATVVASRDDLLGLTYSFFHLDGFQASPYRFVRFFDTLDNAAVSQPERDPERRSRHALAGRWNHHILAKSAVRTQARGYVDSWGVASGTGSVEVMFGVGDFEIAPWVRFYGQKSASFYEGTYLEARRYMTVDRELSTFVDVFGGLRIGLRKKDLGVVEELRADVELTGFYFKFFDFPLLEDRGGFLGQLGLGLSFD
jgi:hypothetical protein